MNLELVDQPVFTSVPPFSTNQVFCHLVYILNDKCKLAPYLNQWFGKCVSYSKSLPEFTTPTSPAPSLSHFSTTNSNNNNSSSSVTNSPKNQNSTANSASTSPKTNNSNNSQAASRSLNNNNNNNNSSSVNTSPSSTSVNLPPHPSAFSPYQNSAQHPTPVTTPTSIPKNPLSQPEVNMMTSHLENGASPTLGYPPHTHFANPTAHPYWPQWSGVNGANGTNGVAVATLSNNQGSAFMPAYGSPAGAAISQHNPRPKLTTTIWEDEATLCYQVDARGICVARRQDNDMINGTKLLNVVGMSRGKRDGILKNEKGRVVVKVGAMHLKGVWITFSRAKALATQFKITELLYPLFVEDPSVFLHNSYGSPVHRIPSMGTAASSQWRPHHFTNTFNNGTYAETGRPWYPYSSGSPVASMIQPTSGSQGTRGHNPHPPQHIEEEYTNYNLMNGQSQQGQQGVVVSGGGRPPAQYEGSPNSQQIRTPNPLYNSVKAEEGSPSNGTTSYFRSASGLYNLVSATEVVGGTTSQSASPQLIGQKRSYDGDDNDEYNNAVNHSNQSSPPLPMHPPPLSSIAVGATMNVAANSFPSPLNVSPQSSPGNTSAFSGWNHAGKRVKYEYPEATTPSSAHSSPRIGPGYQLPGLGAGPATPGSATTPTQASYTNSSLQLVTNAQGSPHHYSSAANNGPATGTTTPTTEGLDRYFQDSAVLNTPPESGGVGTPVEENNRRYDQYRRDESNDELNNSQWE
ncbi:hypothetical protein G9A89_017975 [Geosiphon pyriformis]|nr:hypothetical protein G9A89_017975 [Geosiphon pyriformis]